MKLSLKKLLSKMLSQLQLLTDDRQNKVLWTGAIFMQSGQTATLTESISDQAHGIVLVWSVYSNGAQDWGWQFQFIPKWTPDGSGITYVGKRDATNSTLAIKYVYVSGKTITGHANNIATGTGYANNTLRLRAVLGV